MCNGGLFLPATPAVLLLSPSSSALRLCYSEEKSDGTRIILLLKLAAVRVNVKTVIHVH